MAAKGGGTAEAMARKRPPELGMQDARRVSTSMITTTGSSIGQANGISRNRREASNTYNNGTAAASSVLLSPEIKKPKLHSSTSALRKRKAPPTPFAERVEKQIERTSTVMNLTLERLLRRHGKNISRHPVKTLLVACLIITSLFYPAAGIYLWASKGGPGVTRGDARSVWRSLSTPFLDSFASSGRKHHNSLRDLRMVWDDAPDLRAVDARDANAYLGSIAPMGIFPHNWPATESGNEEKGELQQRKNCTSVRVEHVFVTTDDVMMGLGHRYGVLDTPILQSAMSLQGAIEAYLKKGQDRLTCLQAVQSQDCLTLSPLAFWNQDGRLLSSDSSPTKTLLTTGMNISAQGVPLGLSTTLAGRSHLFTKLPRADHLALTFFLRDNDDCQQTSDSLRADDAFSKNHEVWLDMLRNITGGQVGILNSEITTTKEVVLQFNPLQTSNTFFTQRVLLALSYTAAFIWLCRGLMRLQNVHSRFGLAFTGVIELIISMTLAVSICALCGVRLTLVPWEILPFVVVVLGSENMFVLTNAIISTPISLTVPTRIATGLSKVGVPIAVTVMSDVLLMLTIMMFVDVRAVREFCVFAIFSLFVDFFMQMTFFSTVLSIDLQRLELADLLSQGGPKESQGIRNLQTDNEPSSSDVLMQSEATSDAIGTKKRTKRRSGSIGGSLIKMSCRAIWRARTARTASLSLLLAFMFGIYLYHGSGYPSLHSYPFLQQNTTQSVIAPVPIVTNAVQDDDGTPRFDPYSHLTTDSQNTPEFDVPWWHRSPSALFWQGMNPEDALSVRIKVEPWTVLSLRSTKTFDKAQRTGMAHFASWAIFRPRVRAFIWFFKLAVLPIAGTTGLLWVLLLYLLKDTELLEAQRDRSEGLGDDNSDEEEAEDTKANQIENVEAETSLRTSTASHSCDVVMMAQSGGFIVSLATDSSLSVWKPSKRGKSSTIILSAVIKNFSRVTALEADAELDLIALGHQSGQVSLWTLSSLQPIDVHKELKTQNGVQDEQATPEPMCQVQSILFVPCVSERYTVCSAHRDGSLWRWRPGGHDQLKAAQGDALWVAFSPRSSDGKCRNVIALSSSDHHFQLYRISVESPTLTCMLATHDSSFVVRCATLSTLSFSGDERDRDTMWSIVLAGTNRGAVVVFDLKSGESLGQYAILDGPITSVRAVDYQQACTLIGHTGPRDVILANSTTRATVLTLSKQAEHLSSNAFASPKKGSLSTPQKKRNGLPPMTMSSTNEDAYFEPGRESQDELEVRRDSVSGYVNGAHESRATLLEPMPPSASIANRYRRSSSQSKRPALEDSHPTPTQSHSFEPPPSSASTVGSTHSSVLDHFDVDPFETFNGHDSLYWARYASIECTRGGADIVVDSDGAKVVGVRRRARPLTMSATLDARWEVFQLDMDVLFSPERRHHESLEVNSISRSRLDLEDRLLFQRQGGAKNGSLSSGSLAVPLPSGASRSMPLLLSFTRLDHVQAFYKDTSAGEAGRRRGKKTVIFSFANCVAVVALYQPSV